MSKLADNANEMRRRQGLAERARKTICKYMGIVDQHPESLMTEYQDFFVQISFSSIHPLVVIYLVRRIQKIQLGMLETANRMNLTAVLGSHAINDEADCFTYRATLWLDTELTEKRFQEILDRCVEEALKAFYAINS